MYRVDAKEKQIIFHDSIENVQLNIPGEDFRGLVLTEEPPVLTFPKQYEQSVKNPIGCSPLSVLAQNAKKAAIIVSDATRGVPTAKVLPMVINELCAAGVGEDQITVVIALGVHRPATVEEIRQIAGNDLFNRLKIINHEPYNRDELVYLGETSYGTPIEVNKTVYDADIRIAIGKVEPHEFAGFSGGRKSVLPGIASERTIEANHSPRMLLKKHIGPGMVEKNSINKDMIEGAHMLGLDFIVNFVLNHEGDAIGLFSGDMVEAHVKAIEFMKSFCQVTLQDKPDIVITTPGAPLNIDFYQSIKPIIALAPLMAENGVIVLYTECLDGVNSEDMITPFEGTTSLDDVINNLMADYKIQMDHSLLLCKILQKNIRVVVSSPNIDDEILSTMYLIPAKSPQEALNKAYGLSGIEKPNVLVFPQPQRTLPVLVEHLDPAAN